MARYSPKYLPQARIAPRIATAAFWLAATAASAVQTSGAATDASQDAEAKADTAAIPELTPADVERFVDGFFEKELDETHIPGGVFLIVKEDAVLYARGYGLADLERGVRVSPDSTVFRVGSLSKTVTAAAALQLVEAGRIDLDTDVNTYLQQVEVPERFGQPVTLFQLLTHTAGFNEALFGQHAWSRADWRPLGDFLAHSLPPRSLPPGDVISYNDFGSSLAGLVVEDASGLPFAEYVKRNIFGPLEMNLTSFAVADLPEPIQDNLAVAYRYEDGRFFPYDYDYIQTAPAAGLVTTASDMGRLLLELLAAWSERPTRIMSDSMLRQMTSRQFAHIPRLPGRGFGFAQSFENDRNGYYKNGQATGFTARIFVLPDEGVAFFSAINRSIFDRGGAFNRAAGFHRRLTSAILDRYFPSPENHHAEATAPDPPPNFSERAHEYVGTYRNVVGSRHTIEKMMHFLTDEVEVRDNGDGSLAIGFGSWVEIEPLVFQWAEGGPHYRGFGRDADGKIAYLFIESGAYERAPWFATSGFTVRWIVISASTFLLALVTLIASVFWRRSRSEGSHHPGRAALAAVCGLNLGFLVGLMLFLGTMDIQDLFKGVPSSLSALLVLPIVAGLLALTLPYYSARAWWRGESNLAGRLGFTLTTLVALLFIPFLQYWNLLGLRF